MIYWTSHHAERYNSDNVDEKTDRYYKKFIKFNYILLYHFVSLNLFFIHWTFITFSSVLCDVCSSEFTAFTVVLLWVLIWCITFIIHSFTSYFLKFLISKCILFFSHLYLYFESTMLSYIYTDTYHWCNDRKERYITKTYKWKCQFKRFLI